MRPLPGVQSWEICHPARAVFIRKETLLLIITLTCLKVIVSLITKNKSKILWHTAKFAKSRFKEKSPGRMRTKRQNHKVCSSLRFISSSPGHWQTFKPPSKADFSQVERLTSKRHCRLDRSGNQALANLSLPAQQTRNKDKKCVQLHCGARGEGQRNFRGPRRELFWAKVFSKRQQHRLSLSGMHAKNAYGGAAVTVSTKK